MGDDTAPGVTGEGYLERLIEALPAAAIVIDGVGTIRFATREAGALVERDPNEMIGQSVLSFVDEDTAWAYAGAVAMAGDFAHVVLGPLRITVVGARGTRRTADLWAMSRLDDPVLQGIVCLITPETAAMGLGEAVTSVAGGAPFTTVASRVVRAMQGHPTTADAALLAAGPSGFRVVAAADGLPDMIGPGPWDEAVASGVRQLADNLDGLPAPLAEAARAAGYATVWVEPVGVVEHEPLAVRGALVLWRRAAGRPTPNELNVLHQGASILALAWDHHDRAG